ncbi:MAG: hypothetical protein LQ345_000943 [Seirophora villosa]|nr:MAG: hypothetical protein LQ345_000943 [Seirophora villosa]
MPNPPSVPSVRLWTCLHAFHQKRCVTAKNSIPFGTSLHLSHQSVRDMESIAEAVPKDIDPYKTLNLISTASADEIKSAYKKLALRHHPDKAPASEKHTAHTTFQNIAFAYAILSSPHRRQLYDSTGSTSETLADADDDFNWLSFFRNQYSSISASALADFSTSYKLSAEERRDVLAAYTKHKGKMAKVYEEVMLSDPLEDEERFHTMIDQAIDREEVQAYDAFVKESKKSKDARMRKARREAGDAEKEARTNKKYQSIFGGDGKGGRDTTGSEPEDGDAHSGGAGAKKKKEEKTKADTNDLAAMIQSRQAARSDDFLDRLEAKYAGDAKTGRGKKRKAAQEPDEQAFERTKAKIAKAKAAEQDGDAKQISNGRTKKGVRRPIRPVANGADAEEEEEDGDEDIDLEDGTDGDEEGEASASDVAAEESEEEEEEVKPRRKAQKSKTQKKAPPPPPAAAKKKKKTATAATRTKGRTRGKK